MTPYQRKQAEREARLRELRGGKPRRRARCWCNAGWYMTEQPDGTMNWSECPDCTEGSK